uniref:Resolvase HTH domain-containing protein n=1 Tax=Amphimedon queenslandica TaxID=400682 RepID=A0A1X7SSU9_AMPQE
MSLLPLTWSEQLLRLFVHWKCNLKTIVISAPMCDTLNGRQRFRIPKAQLEYLVENNFTALQMASIIGVSVRTIYCRLADFEVSLCSKYSNLTDDELDESVSGVQNMGVGRQ